MCFFDRTLHEVLVAWILGGGKKDNATNPPGNPNPQGNPNQAKPNPTNQPKPNAGDLINDILGGGKSPAPQPAPPTTAPAKKKKPAQ